MENKENNTLINWIYVIIFSLICLIITAVVVFIPESRGYDMSVLRAIQAILVHYPTIVAKQMCTVGASHCLLWPQLTAVSVLFSHKKYFNGILVVIFTQISWHSIDFIKDIIARERPCGNMCHGYSFPSGHATTTMCFYGILIYLILRYVKNKFWRYFLITIFSIFIFMVSISRMKLNVHFPLDITAGLCVGVILLNLFIICSKTFAKRNIE